MVLVSAAGQTTQPSANFGSVPSGTRRVVENAATQGKGVIVGRGSQQFLKDRPETLRVFLYAPRENKIRRLVARGKTENEAEEYRYGRQ
jgi:cytidylate kinase